jgi:hypothetical protein
MTQLRSFLSTFAVVAVASLGFAACGDDSLQPDGTGASGTGASGGGDPTSDVCIANNCREDAHCGGCPDGRTSCRIEAGETYGFCVACNADTGTGCPDGQVCSSYGECVPEGLSCPEDAEGNPTISCDDNGDCAACSPRHQVCDPTSNKCVACTESNTSKCTSVDICVDNVCTPPCSVECETNNDCGECPTAKACNKRKCSECGPTYPCPAGETCNLVNGTCQKICGKLEAPGTCESDADCSGCADGTYICNQPINGGIGTCIPNATGCTDLGPGALALPDPWNDYTNTCSTDANCANVGPLYNVGAALRDLLGTDEILGQPIGDANVFYPMAVCASISVADNSCGVCVPCRVDADCQDLDIDSLTSQLFPGVGGLVVAVILDAIFGDEDRKIYMYCETVAAGYGVCAPCPGLLNDCGVTGGPIGGSGKCEHEPDEVGTALDPSCSDCAEAVCTFDPYCCNTEWDDLCVEYAAETCSGGTGSTCHDECDTGTKLSPSCSACAGDVCNEDPYCCDTEWDATCVFLAQDVCGLTCN